MTHPASQEPKSLGRRGTRQALGFRVQTRKPGGVCGRAQGARQAAGSKSARLPTGLPRQRLRDTRSGPRSSREHSNRCWSPALLLLHAALCLRSCAVPLVYPKLEEKPGCPCGFQVPLPALELSLSGESAQTLQLFLDLISTHGNSQQINILPHKDGDDGYGPYSIIGEGNPRVTRPSVLPDAHTHSCPAGLCRAPTGEFQDGKKCWDFSCRLKTARAVRTTTCPRGTSLWTEPSLKLC